MRTLTVAESFWAKVRLNGPTVRPELGKCWSWRTIGSRYVNLTAGGRTILAHRASWELHRGPIPDGLHVLHKCDNPSCTKPDHLFLGTEADNALDRSIKGRHRNQRKTACPSGHPYDEENTAITPGGDRRCRACGREYQRRRRAKSDVIADAG